MELHMRKQIVLGAAMALGLVSAPVFADFSYSNVEVGFHQGEIDGIDGGEGVIGADGDGFLLAGSAAFGESVFGFASFGSLSLDDFELDGVSVSAPGAKVKVKPLSVGVGFHWPLGESVDFVSGLSYERLKVSASDGVDSFSDSENGYGISAGLRGRLGESLELTGTLKYLDLGGSEFVYSVGGRYYFTSAFAAGIDYTKYDDAKLSILGVVLRYDFGAE
jgi:opacity protein-like surface antigen